MRKITIYYILVFLLLFAGCKKENTELNINKYMVYSVDDLGRRVKSMGYSDAKQIYDGVSILLYGKVSSVDSNTVLLSSDIVDISVYLGENEKLSCKEGDTIKVLGEVSLQDVICEDEEDKEELLNNTKNKESLVLEDMKTNEFSVETTILEENNTEKTTMDTDTYLQEIGVDISQISKGDAPIEYRVKSDDYKVKYTLEFNYLESISLANFEEYNYPIEFGKKIEIAPLLSDEELILKAKESIIKKYKEDMQRKIEESELTEKTRLNSMSINELVNYIKSGCDGKAIVEPSLNDYTVTPLTYFDIEGNKILGLTEEGKKLKVLVVPDMEVAEDTKLWDDIKESNCVEELVFTGRYFNEAKIKVAETEDERKKREYNNIPEPFEVKYSSSFKIKTAALRDCTSLRVVILPYGVDTISDYAFAGCTNLKYVKMPKEVFELGGHIFDGCTSLYSLIMPDRIHTSYNTEVLYNMSSLVNLVFTSNNATSAGLVDSDMYIFKGCTSLERVAVSNTLSFDKSRLDNVYSGLDDISFKFKEKSISILGDN